MGAFRQILIGTDFSPRAGLALERATLLASEHQATLHLVHALDLPPLERYARVLVEHPHFTEKNMRRAANDRLRRLARALHRRHGIDVRHKLLVGRAHEQLPAYARAHDTDLTVVGAHGESFVRDLFVGATALKLLRKAAGPILVVQSEPSGPYRDVMIALDFSPASKSALAAAVAIAPAATMQALHAYEFVFEGKLRFAGVDEDDIQQYRHAAARDARQAMNELLREVEGGERVERIVHHGPPARTLLDQAQLRRADLVVMGKRGQSELDALLLGGVTKHVLYEIDRDLLLVSPPGQP